MVKRKATLVLLAIVLVFTGCRGGGEKPATVSPPRAPGEVITLESVSYTHLTLPTIYSV